MKKVSPAPGPSVGLRTSIPVNVSVTYWMMASWSIAINSHPLLLGARGEPDSLRRAATLLGCLRLACALIRQRDLTRAEAPPKTALPFRLEGGLQRGAHHRERGFDSCPQGKRFRALVEQHREAADRPQPGGVRGAHQRGFRRIVDHIHDKRGA